MKTATIKSIVIKNTETGSDEIYPEIPFDQFPKGQRTAGPDNDGNLVWTIHVEE